MMAKATLSHNDTDTVTAPARRKTWKKTFWRGFLYFPFFLCGLLFVLFLASIVFLQDRLVPVPSIFKEVARDGLERQLNGADVEFSGVQFGLTGGLRPRLLANGIVISPKNGLAPVDIGSILIDFEPKGLFLDSATPSSVAVTGGVLQLNRSNSGEVFLGFGDQAGIGGQSFKDLFDQIPLAWNSLAFSGFQELRIEDLTVQYDDTKTGTFLTFDGGRLVAQKEGNDIEIRLDLAILTGRDDPATVALSYSKVGSGDPVLAADIDAIWAKDLARHAPAMEWLSDTEAVVTGNLRTSIRKDNFGKTTAQLQLAKGNVQVLDTELKFDKFKTYVIFDPTSQILNLENLSFHSQKVDFEGKISLMPATSNGDAIVQVEAEKIRLAGNEFVPFPVALSNAVADVRLSASPYAVEIGTLNVALPQGSLKMRGALRQVNDQWEGKLSTIIKDLDVVQALPLWPLGVAEKQRLWFEENVTSALITDGQIHYETSPSGTKTQVANLHYSNADFRFMRHLPNMQDASGLIELKGSRLVISLDKGRIRAPSGDVIMMKPSSMVVEDITKKPAMATYNAAASSSITGALSILDQKPMEIMKKANRPVDLMNGITEWAGVFSAPLKKGNKPEDVGFDVQGVLADVVSTQILPNQRLTASRLDFRATPKEIEIAGPVNFAGSSADVVWTKPSGPANVGVSRLVADIAVTQDVLSAFNVALPAGSFSGTTNVSAQIDFSSESAPKFALSSNMQGATLKIPQISWEKAARQTARLTVAGQLSTPMVISDISIDSEGLTAAGDLAFNQDNTFRSANLAAVKAGSWLDAGVQIISNGKGRPPRFEVTGNRFDLSQMPKGQGQGLPIFVANLDRFQFSKDHYVSNFRARLTGAGSDGYTGRLMGNTDISGSLTQRSGQLIIGVSSSNGGAVLRDLGVFSKANEGELTAQLIQSRGKLTGDMNIKNVRVKHGPAVGELLSAISVVGLLELLDGKGLLFSEMSTKFQLEDGLVTVFEGSAMGPSLGISIDGFVDTSKNSLDLQGVVSPFYILNGIGSFLTRRGEGLIGFNFTLKGDASKPSVGVNPLSVFTPGMFRDIFRRQPPNIAQ